MSRKITASDRKSLIRLASGMPKGSPERKAILAGLKVAGGFRFSPRKEKWHRGDSWPEKGAVVNASKIFSRGEAYDIWEVDVTWPVKGVPVRNTVLITADKNGVEARPPFISPDSWDAPWLTVNPVSGAKRMSKKKALEYFLGRQDSRKLPRGTRTQTWSPRHWGEEEKYGSDTWTVGDRFTVTGGRKFPRGTMGVVETIIMAEGGPQIVFSEGYISPRWASKSP